VFQAADRSRPVSYQLDAFINLQYDLSSDMLNNLPVNISHLVVNLIGHFKCDRSSIGFIQDHRELL
jgi:hypothetical protein